jgi:hypothetical protein
MNYKICKYVPYGIIHQTFTNPMCWDILIFVSICVCWNVIALTRTPKKNYIHEHFI